jgi:hypothetical protein
VPDAAPWGDAAARLDGAPADADSDAGGLVDDAGPTDAAVAADSGFIVLATGQSVRRMVVGPSYLYWSHDPSPQDGPPSVGAILKAPIGGGTVEAVQPAIVRPDALVLVGSTLFFTTRNQLGESGTSSTGSVRAVGVDGLGGWIIDAAANDPGGIAVANGNVYWSSYFTPAIWSASVTPGAVRTRVVSATAAAYQTWDVAANASGLFWTSATIAYHNWGGVFERPWGGGPLRHVVGAALQYRVAADDTTVYSCDGGLLYAYAIDPPGGSRVLGSAGMDCVFALGPRAVYMAAAGEIHAFPLPATATAAPVRVAAGLSDPPIALAVDDHNVYFAGQDGWIVQIPKP